MYIIVIICRYDNIKPTHLLVSDGRVKMLFKGMWIMKKIIVVITMIILLSAAAVFADDTSSQKIIETNLSKRVAVFQVKGAAIPLYNELEAIAAKYRVSSYKWAYDKASRTVTFTVSYNTGNLNVAIPDAIVNSEKELQDILFAYTKGKTQQNVCITLSTSLDETNDSMYVIKVTYTKDWKAIQKTIADINFCHVAPYRKVFIPIAAICKYPHQVQTVVINEGFTAADKAYYDKYALPIINQINTTNASELQIAYNLVSYMNKNWTYDVDKFYTLCPVYAPPGYVSKYDYTKDRFPWEDKNGVCEDFTDATTYILSELDIKVIEKAYNIHTWNEIEIDGTYYRLDTTGAVCDVTGSIESVGFETWSEFFLSQCKIE